MSVDYLNFFEIQGGFIIGNNNTGKCDGIKEGSNVPHSLVIPFEHNGQPVLEIAQYAFQALPQIHEVTIKAQLRQINKCAFYMCENIEKINIPESVKILGESAIDLRYVDINAPSPNRTEIIFERHSQILHLFSAAICNRKYVRIYLCDVITPTFTDEWVFGGIESLIIYAPERFTFITNTTIIGPCLPPSLCFLKTFRYMFHIIRNFQVYVLVLIK